VADGWVKRCGWSNGGGNCIVLSHPHGFTSFYNHLSRFAGRIHRGVRVKQREIIGYVGSTGFSTGPHLDYRLQKDGSFINPLQKIMLPGTPVAQADRPRFLQVREELMGRLEGGSLQQPSCEPFEELVPQSF
jgi:murein DD-endopeptidase MepM/ murein hydrolase activator NlpD